MRFTHLRGRPADLAFKLSAASFAGGLLTDDIRGHILMGVFLAVGVILPLWEDAGSR